MNIREFRIPHAKVSIVHAVTPRLLQIRTDPNPNLIVRYVRKRGINQ